MKETIASSEAATRMKTKDPLGVNTEIGRKLKQYYDGLVSEDVPDRFTELLSRLEAVESAKRGD